MGYNDYQLADSLVEANWARRGLSSSDCCQHGTKRFCFGPQTRFGLDRL